MKTIKLTKEKFDTLVGVNNPYSKGVYYAFITWNCYDYSESGDSPETAKERLWELNFNN